MALVKAPLAPRVRVVFFAVLGEVSAAEEEVVEVGGGTGRPVETLLLTLELAEEVPCAFLELIEEVVMVVFPDVGGKRPPEPSVVFGEDILACRAREGQQKRRDGAGYRVRS